ncbi:MAG TPA: transcription termination/antitermination protein NusA, partial [Rhizobiales bacterium]|nr:transcription termination/antitermination protein NusA [Hyphomicrobiales bacterium]
KEFAERSQMFMESLDVDEVIAQLLASEGFTSVEEAAFVEISEIANIEGFDEETATEIQTRAREYLDRREQELNKKRAKLGVEDAMSEIPGMTLEMMVALGENEIKTVEDFAGCVTDDLTGWHEKVESETVRHPGYLDEFGVSRPDAEAMIMAARVQAGWITEEDLQGDAEGEGEDAKSSDDAEAADGDAEAPPAKSEPEAKAKAEAEAEPEAEAEAEPEAEAEAEASPADGDAGKGADA